MKIIIISLLSVLSGCTIFGTKEKPPTTILRIVPIVCEGAPIQEAIEVPKLDFDFIKDENMDFYVFTVEEAFDMTRLIQDTTSYIVREKLVSNYYKQCIADHNLKAENST